MPRKIVFKDASKEVDGSLLSASRPKAGVKLTPQQIERLLREKRSPRYMEAISKLDGGIHATDRKAYEEIMNIIREELPEITAQYPPLGLVAKCYLGHPYEVHTLDNELEIITHYETYRSMPSLLEKARSLAIHEEYAFIEVYLDKMVAVYKDGGTSLINY